MNQIEPQENVTYVRYSYVKEQISVDRDNLLVVCFACDWCFPSLASARHVEEAEKKEKYPGVRFFLINQEAERDICTQYGILVGSSVLMAWWRGESIVFRRPEFGADRKLIGPFHQKRIAQLVESLAAARERGPLGKERLYVADIS
eukprot:TRINITY_DN21944_c0_g1_i1.p1 TRINITY_DN21944_c0_g1~~TRINITY_DN21944_c0_g1_i1.p1  ORF type:complete len:165 (-),score=45.59 TRINITY_DN21944_c0_g1_i1:21-458(-)